MPGGRRARGSGQAYALLLLYRLWQRVAELETRPPVTTALIAVMLLVFGIGSAGKGGARALPPHLSTPVRAVQAVLDVRRSCLRPADVLFNGERHRLLLSSLIHLDEAHLLYNMLSFVHKGVTLETQMGSAPFAALIVYLAFVAHVLYCAVALALSAAAASPQLLNSCVAGFSGVLFGLGTVLSSSAEHRDAARSIFGFRVPNAGVAALAEVVAAQLLVPRASFTGHACGALAGLSFTCVTRALAARAPAPRRRRQTQLGGGPARHAHAE